MGSNSSLSNGNEVKELIGLLRAFEAMGGSRCAIVLYVVLRGGKARLIAGIGKAPAVPMEQVLSGWGSHQFVLEVHEQVTLMAVLSQLMYGLDYVRAEAEFDKLSGESA